MIITTSLTSKYQSINIQIPRPQNLLDPHPPPRIRLNHPRQKLHILPLNPLPQQSLPPIHLFPPFPGLRRRRRKLAVTKILHGAQIKVVAHRHENGVGRVLPCAAFDKGVVDSWGGEVVAGLEEVEELRQYKSANLGVGTKVLWEVWDGWDGWPYEDPPGPDIRCVGPRFAQVRFWAAVGYGCDCALAGGHYYSYY